MKAFFQNVLGVVSMLALVLHTILLSGAVLFCALLRWLLPENTGRKYVGPSIKYVSDIWLRGILWWMDRVLKMTWDIKNNVDLSTTHWYMVISNHQSWVDIFALYHVLLGNIPFLKFFIKKELLHVPVVGQAWWALDFPFMQRHSRAVLAKNPEKANDDLEATRKACERFQHDPTSIVNFLEGTRYTQEKHDKQKSPFKHLLRPKAGGLAFAVQALGARFNTMINTTIVYHGHRPSFWDLARGRVGKVSIRMEAVEIPERFVEMDYINNREHKKDFQQWINQLWTEKDELIESVFEAEK